MDLILFDAVSFNLPLKIMLHAIGNVDYRVRLEHDLLQSNLRGGSHTLAFVMLDPLFLLLVLSFFSYPPEQLRLVLQALPQLSTLSDLSQILEITGDPILDASAVSFSLCS